MFRKLISKFNSSLSESMVSSRRRHTAPVKIWFEPEINSERARELATGERWEELQSAVFHRTLDPWAAADEMLGTIGA